MKYFKKITTGFNIHSDSVFRYGFKKDILIGAFLIIVLISILFTRGELGNIPTYLNRNDVNAFDRWLMFPYNMLLDNIKFILLALILALPIISPLSRKIRSKTTMLTYGIMYGQAFIFTFGIRAILKNMIDRYRPYMYFDCFPTVFDFHSSDFHRSFPSGTAALAFLPATFLSVTFSAEFPNSPWKMPIIVGSHILAAGIGATRIFNGTHFLTDVLVGAVIGIFFGWLIPTLHKRENSV